MFGGGYPCSMPYCQQPMMCPYDVPCPQPYPCPYPVPQPYLQNIYQPVDMPIQNTIQPVIVPQPFCMPVPQPVPVPYERPCVIPIPQPVPVPVDQPYPVPVQVPVNVPVPQPYPVPHPIVVREQVCVPVQVPVPFPVQMPAQYQYIQQEEYYYPPEEEYDEPIYIKHHRRRHHRRRYRSCPPGPLPPIIIPIPMQEQICVAEPPPLQITEYVQDIYPPAQVYTDQVQVGYAANNSMIQQPAQIQNQQTLNCQSGIILPPSPYIQPQQQQQQLIQQLPSGQCIQRPLTVGGGGLGSIQSIVASPQPCFSSSHPTGLISPCQTGSQLMY
ncbi:unnamed protein product [Adineta steineri]|uniref:Uncharacterized protein n=1 Tax=Adineta steineri TaxID=433720 RepID=A0A814WXL4_9BILA|nr:unnamed protein product [Adineta steineri]